MWWISSRTRTLSHSRHDQLLIWILRAVALVAAAVVLFVVLFVLLEALPALKHVGVLRFLQDDSWHPTEGQFGIRPMLLGTVFVTAGAALLAIPLGLHGGRAHRCGCAW